MATISQRITLEGGDDIRRAFDNLAAAVNKLSPQFNQLTSATQAFGNAGTQASRQVTDGLNETSQAADRAGTSLLTAAKRFTIAAAGIAVAVSAIVRSLTSGAGETAQTISDQADRLGLTTQQWIALRRSVDAARGSTEEFATSIAPMMRSLNQLGAESGRSFQTFANGATVVTQTVGKLTPASQQLVAALEKLGVRRDIIDKGSLATMQELARIIDGMPEGAAKAAAAAQFQLGPKWRDTLSALTVGIKSVGDAEAELDNKRAASRQLTEDQVKAAKAAADQWTDLGNAIRAAKDQIGALFSGSSFARAKWLTDLVDDSRILLQQWRALSAAGHSTEEILEGLGDGAAATAFKILIALGQQLSGIWRDVLVPAGRSLFGVFDSIAGLFEGITGSQVAAFFITLGIAVAGLAVALGALQLLLGPVLALFSPFGAILLAAGLAAVVFWDKISAGAKQVAALVPAELQQIAASFKKLFAGDFAGFWAQFSAAAVAAFQKITAAFAETELGAALIKTFNQLKEELPGAIVLITKAFLSILPALDKVAGAINTVFGTKLTGTDLLVLGIVGHWTGAFNLLAEAAITFGNVFGGPVKSALAIAGIAALAFTMRTQDMQKALEDGTAWEKLKQQAIAAFDAIARKMAEIGWQAIKDQAAIAWAEIKQGIWDAGDALDAFVARIPGIAWEALKGAGVGAWNAITSAINNAIDALLKFIGLRPSAPAGGSPVPGHARGGLIGGRGTGTSDSNLSWVSRGEHIMPARAVAQPGVLAFLEMLRRSGGDLRRVMDGMGRFATGGLVGMPAFAGGGAGGIGHLGTVDLRTDHGSVTMMASSSAVDQLSRLAVTKRITSTGRKPGFIS